MNDIQLYEDIAELKNNFPIKVRKYRNRSIPAHWHEHIELLYLLSGKTVFVCNGKNFSVRHGDLVVVNSGELHYFADEAEIEYICIIIDVSLLSDAGSENILLQSKISSDPTVKDSALRIYESYAKEQASSALIIQGETCLLMAHLIDHYTAERLPSGEYDLRLAHIKKVNVLLDDIRENYNHRVTTASLAAKHHFSESHLCRLFKAVCGMTVTEYLNRIRVEKATVLLKNTDESVSSIAKSVGFDNLNYFDRVFRKHLDCSPGDYKRNAALSDNVPNRSNRLDSNAKHI